MVSRGLWQGGKFSEDTTEIDRCDDEEEEVTFPAMMPRRFIYDLFGTPGMESRKVFESHDKKSLLFYCWAGREI